MKRNAYVGFAACLSIASPAFAQSPPADAAVLAPAALAHADGEQIFRHICQGCHMPDARGAQGAGRFPALAGDKNLESASFAAATVLFGRRDMPSFGPRPDLRGFEAFMHVDLSDAQVAAVVNYVRSHFGNHFAGSLGAADVAALHPATPRKP
ncbi:MAG: cytochrome c [Proteobacteria bacterium]|nr:cytochrome c [Pseudomonadota bacterium]